MDEYLRCLEALLSPDLYILGGGISTEHAKFLQFLTLDTPVLPAELGNDAGIVGAALAAKPSRPPSSSQAEKRETFEPSFPPTASSLPR